MSEKATIDTERSVVNGSGKFSVWVSTCRADAKVIGPMCRVRIETDQMASMEIGIDSLDDIINVLVGLRTELEWLIKRAGGMGDE